MEDRIGIRGYSYARAISHATILFGQARGQIFILDNDPAKPFELKMSKHTGRRG